VADEIAGQGEFRQGADLFTRESWIKIEAVPSPSLTLLPVFLGKGEVEVIQLGIIRSGSLLLIDDYRARRAAEALHLAATGTVGVLVRAKECGLVPAVVPLLREMRDCGYYIGEAVVEMARIRAGE
jgi:predicted nucleic acid-binding protein